MNILFLCVGNSARSQIAEGLAREILGKNHVIESAGSIPTGKINSNAVWAMNEIGIDISSQHSKSTEDLEKSFMDNLDFVITLCAEEVCPILNNNAKKIHWMNEDPVNVNFSDAQSKAAFIKVRDNLYNLIKKFFILNT
jgi:arsenate reductase